jgi:dihydropteridine reductase
MSKKSILVFGGQGSLGRNFLSHLKKENTKNFHSISIDKGVNSDASHSIDLSKLLSDKNVSWSEQVNHIQNELKSHLGNKTKLNGIINLAGGFCMGDLNSSALFEDCESMWKNSVQTSILSAKLSVDHMVEQDPLLVLPGAFGTYNERSKGTGALVAYGTAKASVHYLVRSLGSNTKESGLPEKCTVLGIMPTMLDTEPNRNAMPDVDHSNWTPLDHVSEKITKWIESKNSRPPSGVLLKIQTNNNKTHFIEFE